MRSERGVSRLAVVLASCTSCAVVAAGVAGVLGGPVLLGACLMAGVIATISIHHSRPSTKPLALDSISEEWPGNVVINAPRAAESLPEPHAGSGAA